MKLPRISLLLRILIAIVLGIVFGLFFNETATRVFATFNSIFSNFLSLMIPFIILGLIIPGIAKLGKGSGKLLLITVLLSYGFTFLAGCFSMGVCLFSYPLIMENSTLLNVSNIPQLQPYFTISMPPVINVMSALVVAFIFGLGISTLKSKALLNVAEEFKKVVEITIGRVIIPLLPLYIFGIFLIITYTGQVATVLSVFFKIILLIFAITFVFLFIQFAIAGILSKKNPFRMMRIMMLAYVTALGTQSSAATIPVTLEQAKKLGIKDEVADFVIPLCATIHLSGSTMKIVAYAMAIMLMMNMPFDLWQFIGFILMLGITMVAAPGVPGGAIMAALGLLQVSLGFNETASAIIIALYMATDSFGTATNVTGDGSIAVIVDYLSKNKSPKK